MLSRQSLDVQLSFKEQRIRQLSGRLRKPIQASRGGDISKIDLLLNDADLQSINSGKNLDLSFAEHESHHRTTSKKEQNYEVCPLPMHYVCSIGY